ncbi:hypothetical protein BU17DRAFT_68355 [Hysterangium stoloniferum]|nr:hypothetical protein BU17DRAFT_68355 [Hysterangium stoloniferum]
MLQFIPASLVVPAAGATGCAIGAVIAVPVAVSLLGVAGFSSTGVVAGRKARVFKTESRSTAAAIQSSAYGAVVTSGSSFAMAQSLAAGGTAMGSAITYLGVAALGAAGAAGAALNAK